MIDPAERSPHPSRPDATRRSVSDLVGDLATDASELVRQEIAVAQAEIASAGKRTARELALVGVAGLILALGALVLLVALVLSIGGLIGSYWLAALIAGAVLAGGGAWASLHGARLLRGASLAPSAAIDELGATASWAGHELSGLKSTLLDGERDHGPTPAPLRTSPAVTLPLPGPAPLPDRSGRREPAASPAAAPAAAGAPRGGGSLLKRLKREILADDVLGRAAQLAYYAFLAMPPALMALFGAAGLIGSDRFANWLEGQAALALPAAVMETIIRPFVNDVVRAEAPGPFSLGLLLAVWGASSVFSGLMVALNITYDVEEMRPWIKRRALAFATMIGSVVLFLLAALALLAGPAIARAVDLGGTGMLVWNLVQWPLAFSFMVAAFWTTYYVLPNRDQSGCKLVLLKAAAVAALGWVLATAAFRLYIANFSSYTEAYGFLGAFIILLLWLYLTGIVVLTGGELASEMERGR